jgi:hypothetical protein
VAKVTVVTVLAGVARHEQQRGESGLYSGTSPIQSLPARQERAWMRWPFDFKPFHCDGWHAYSNQAITSDRKRIVRGANGSTSSPRGCCLTSCVIGAVFLIDGQADEHSVMFRGGDLGVSQPVWRIAEERPPAT